MSDDYGKRDVYAYAFPHREPRSTASIWFASAMTLGACLLLFACVHTSRATPAGQISERDYVRICRGTIAAVMGKNIDIVSAEPRTEDGPVGPIVALSYVRESDRTEHRFRCYLDGYGVVWSMEGGRWRTHPADGTIGYTINREAGNFTIRQKFGDGTVDEKTFSL